MYSHAMMLYLFLETPLHAGSGREVGAVDLPIQREKATGYPLVQASSVKGKLRAEATTRESNKDILFAVFGPDPETVQKDAEMQFAGAVSPGDAKILLFPVRSLAGIFAWVTSINVLARFRRDAAAAGLTLPEWPLTAPQGESALVATTNDVTAGGKVVLEEFSYTPQPTDAVATIGGWLAENTLPADGAYAYWREKLPRSLVILPEDDFRDFARYGTEIVTRIRIEDETKTVASGALWTEENLPADTLLYTTFFASTPYRPADGVADGAAVLKFIQDLQLNRVQLGGDETVGRGLTAVRYGEVNHVQ
ncbi:MAG: type III-B CRISPR module RAMP protein Cmr4 [Anaerolineae bacterium]|nr:type III-B CRISPR module RAMP protein Cmr4 [Anaerolineae bacterium]